MPQSSCGHHDDDDDQIWHFFWPSKADTIVMNGLAAVGTNSYCIDAVDTTLRYCCDYPAYNTHTEEYICLFAGGPEAAACSHVSKDVFGKSLACTANGKPVSSAVASTRLSKSWFILLLSLCFSTLCHASPTNPSSLPKTTIEGLLPTDNQVVGATMAFYTDNQCTNELARHDYKIPAHYTSGSVFCEPLGEDLPKGTVYARILSSITNETQVILSDRDECADTKPNGYIAAVFNAGGSRCVRLFDTQQTHVALYPRGGSGQPGLYDVEPSRDPFGENKAPLVHCKAFESSGGDGIPTYANTYQMSPVVKCDTALNTTTCKIGEDDDGQYDLSENGFPHGHQSSPYWKTISSTFTALSGIHVSPLNVASLFGRRYVKSTRIASTTYHISSGQAGYVVATSRAMAFQGTFRACGRHHRYDLPGQIVAMTEHGNYLSLVYINS